MTNHSRLRVLFVIGSMGGGGAERQVLEILKRLDRSRFEPFLYLANRQGELLSEVPADVPIFACSDCSNESRVRRILRWMKLARLSRNLHLARVLREQQIQLIYDRTYLATLDAAGACLFRPTPRISCCVVDPQPELELHARISKDLSWSLARRAYSSASVVLTNSEGLRQRFIEYFRLSPDHVRVFYNLLTSLRLDGEIPEEQELELALIHRDINQQLTDTKNTDAGKYFLIVTAGRLHPQKGHRFLLEAVDELVHRRNRSLKLIIFGRGESESSLRNYVRTQRLESCVMIAGFVKEPRLWYPKASLFVLPSLFEGMPNALIEAAASGLPVISTDCPSGPAEILDQGRCGKLVPAGDALALADAIEEAMDHPDEWRARAELARQRVTELFDPVIGIARLEKLVEQVIAGDHGKN